MSYDADAAAYITAVETADSASLPTNIADAINDFVVGCKADSIWTPIKAACFLAGPATLAGALVPLVGSAPTNVSGNFGSGDYNQLTGLKGNASNKRLGANYAYPGALQDNCHAVTYQTESGSAGVYFGATNAGGQGTQLVATTKVSRHYTGAVNFTPSSPADDGFHGLSRSASGSYVYRSENGNQTASNSSVAATLPDFSVFARSIGTSFDAFTNARLSFYSFGEALDLSLLNARLTTYMAAIAAPPLTQSRRRRDFGGFGL